MSNSYGGFSPEQFREIQAESNPRFRRRLIKKIEKENKEIIAQRYLKRAREVASAAYMQERLKLERIEQERATLPDIFGPLNDPARGWVENPAREWSETLNLNKEGI